MVERKEFVYEDYEYGVIGLYGFDENLGNMYCDISVFGVFLCDGNGNEKLYSNWDCVNNR